MDGFGEEPPADLIIEAIDGELYGPKQPKVILFDIGGVCVSYFPTQLFNTRSAASNGLL